MTVSDFSIIVKNIAIFQQSLFLIGRASRSTLPIAQRDALRLLGLGI